MCCLILYVSELNLYFVDVVLCVLVENIENEVGLVYYVVFEKVFEVVLLSWA